MWRLFHSVLGLGGLLVIMFLAVTGSLMSVAPAIDALGPYARPAGDMSVAEALAVLTPKFREIDKLQQTSAGAFVLHYRRGGKLSRDYVDVHSGQVLGHEVESPFFAFVRDLHRSLRLGDGGRFAAGIGAAIMTLLCLSGAALLIKRFGGIRRRLRPYSRQADGVAACRQRQAGAGAVADHQPDRALSDFHHFPDHSQRQRNAAALSRKPQGARSGSRAGSGGTAADTPRRYARGDLPDPGRLVRRVMRSRPMRAMSSSTSSPAKR